MGRNVGHEFKKLSLIPCNMHAKIVSGYISNMKATYFNKAIKIKPQNDQCHPF